jgi:hypothetical protein
MLQEKQARETGETSFSRLACNTPFSGELTPLRDVLARRSANDDMSTPRPGEKKDAEQ